jgi:hypothetical protein
MTTLKSLLLTATQVNDGSLTHLHGLPKLQWLDVRRTRVSAGAAKELKTTLPEKCFIATQLFDPDEPTSMSFGQDGRSGGTATIRQGVWMLYARSTGSIALFELSKDPRERRNVATDFPDVVARLLAEVRAWIQAGKPSSEQREWLRQHGKTTS